MDKYIRIPLLPLVKATWALSDEQKGQVIQCEKDQKGITAPQQTAKHQPQKAGLLRTECGCGEKQCEMDQQITADQKINIDCHFFS